jgi:hypothetical protein
MNFLERFFKNPLNFLDNTHIAEEDTKSEIEIEIERERERERERYRRIINVGIRNFFKQLHMNCTSTGTLQIFCPFRKWSQIHITLCQINTASHIVIG